jgi:hypothetical protein
MKFVLIFLLLPFTLTAQQKQILNDITGVWAGNLYNDTTKQYIHFELAISDFNGKLNGYSHTTFIIDSIKNIGVKAVKIKNKKGNILIEDEKLIDNDYREAAAKGVRTFIELAPSENDSAEILSGTWHTNRTREYNSLTGSIFLERKKKIFETAIIPKLLQMGLSSNLSFLPRQINSEKSMVINKGISNGNSEDLHSSGGNVQINKKTLEIETPNDPERMIAASNRNKSDEKNSNDAKSSPENKNITKTNNESTELTALNGNFSGKKSNIIGNTQNKISKEPVKLGNENSIKDMNSSDESGAGGINSKAANKTITPQENEIESTKKAINVSKQIKRTLDEKDQNESIKKVVEEEMELSEKDKNGENKTFALNKEVTNVPDKEVSKPGKGIVIKLKQDEYSEKVKISEKDKNGENKTIALNKKDINSNISHNEVAEQKERIVSDKKWNELSKKVLNEEIKISEKDKTNQQKLTVLNKKEIEPILSDTKISQPGNKIISKNKDSLSDIAVFKEKTNPVIDNSKIQEENLLASKEVKSNNQEKFSIDEKDMIDIKNKNEIKPEEKSLVVNNLHLVPANQIIKKEITLNAASEISKREIETIRTVEILQDSLVFTLYDNGAVDGDTVSILLNGKVIMPRVGLSEKAYNKTIYLTPEMGDSIYIIMYAENLGSIPPNTGLLVVRDGPIDYEIRFTGDMKKNSAIILKRKKKN